MKVKKIDEIGNLLSFSFKITVEWVYYYVIIIILDIIRTYF